MVSCDFEGDPSQNTISTTYIYEIDPLFKNLNNRLENLCGNGISPLFQKRGKDFQYTEGCLFVYDPEAPAVKRNTLYPLGKQWGVEEPPEPQPDTEVQGEVVYLNGHLIWNEVLPTYIRIGPSIIGRPLTGVNYNPQKNWYEQYFENMGFYREVDAPEGEIKVMDYGVWTCGKSCLGDEFAYFQQGIPPTPIFTPVPEEMQIAESTMMAAVDRLGRSFIGPALTEIYQAPDGMYEKLFQNAFLFVDPGDISRVQFRPLPLMVGITQQPPVSPVNQDSMYFFPVMGNDLGYNVPNLFMEFITLHGTMEVFGTPIEELQSLEPGVSRQCFTQLCLEYHAKAPKVLRIVASPLGFQYSYQTAPTPTAVPIVQEQPIVVEQPQATPEPTITTESPVIEVQAIPVEAVTPTPRQFTQPLNLQVWEKYSMLSPSESQEIGVALFEGDQPLSDVGFSLSVSLPGESTRVYVMPLTSSNGMSAVSLEPINVPLGSVIPYQVCITNILELPVCINESFIIWGGE